MTKTTKTQTINKEQYNDLTSRVEESADLLQKTLVTLVQDKVEELESKISRLQTGVSALRDDIQEIKLNIRR